MVNYLFKKSFQLKTFQPIIYSDLWGKRGVFSTIRVIGKKPNYILFSDHIKKIANTSIDISDGLLADLDKMINSQKLSYKLNLRDIPISHNLKKILNTKKLHKINYISKGDDYQVLFTAPKNKRRIIRRICSNNRIKLTKIGLIQSQIKKSSIVDHKNREITLKNKGYFHHF